MSIVVFIWVYSLGSHFNNKTSEQANNDLKPFKLFANSISNTYQNITASAGSASTTKEEVRTRLAESAAKRERVHGHLAALSA
jgi:hypothetical protein